MKPTKNDQASFSSKKIIWKKKMTSLILLWRNNTPISKLQSCWHQTVKQGGPYWWKSIDKMGVITAPCQMSCINIWFGHYCPILQPCDVYIGWFWYLSGWCTQYPPFRPLREGQAVYWSFVNSSTLIRLLWPGPYKSHYNTVPMIDKQFITPINMSACIRIPFLWKVQLYTEK